jgi:glycosyltransferase involved in cell wall biosynthesis
VNPVVIILPEGATIGGVTSWACSLGSVLAGRGRAVTLLVHGGIAGHEAVELDVGDGVEVEQLELGTPRSFEGGLEGVVAAYGAAADRAAARAGAEALLIPTRDADCFAACAMVAQAGGARLVGWRHSPMAYERAIFERYGWAMARVIGVSAWLCEQMRRLLPERAGDVGLVGNGVVVPEEVRRREGGLRLIYTGRLDEPVKRVSALVAMSESLTRRGVEHVLTIVGDGPAEGALRAEAGACVRFVGAQSPAAVGRLLSEHDVFVLGSRMEGLSLSAIEAMAAGCGLVLTATASGAADLVGDGEAGELVEVSADADGAQAGLALADGVERLVGRGVREVGQAAHERARRLFSVESMGDAAMRELDLAGRADVVRGQAVEAFHGGASPGSVPGDAGARMQRVLGEIGPGGVAIHGLGAHTEALRVEIEAAGSQVVAFADDDPSRCGEVFLGRAVVSPERAGETGARHVVISSWLHEEAIWARRAVYERQGLTVHRLYGVGAGV